jgi:hypothetical protein
MTFDIYSLTPKEAINLETKSNELFDNFFNVFN